jgi:hypothetical protein
VQSFIKNPSSGGYVTYVSTRARQWVLNTVIIFLLVLLVGCEPDPIGTWTRQEGDIKLQIHFSKDGVFTSEPFDPFLGRAKAAGEIVRWTINTNVTPFQLDILYPGGLKSRCIFDFPAKRRLRVATNTVLGERPKDFESAHKTREFEKR